MKALGKPTEILSKLTEMAGFPPNEEIELYEVCFSSMAVISVICLSHQLGSFIVRDIKRMNGEQIVT